MKKLISTLLFSLIITLAMGQPISILPISLKNFNVELKDEHSVEVTWDIIHQNSAKGYSIEHSMDGSTWQPIGYLGDAATDKLRSFKFTHQRVGNGYQYYRIRLISFTEKIFYSDVKTILVKSKTTFSVWPNPAQQFLYIQNNIKGKQLSKVIVLNQNGIKLTEITVAWGQNRIDIQQLKAGVYFLQLQTASNHIEVFQFIKQ